MIFETPFVEHQFDSVKKHVVIDLLNRCLRGDTHAYFSYHINVMVMRELHNNGIITVTKSGEEDGISDYIVYYSRTDKTLLYINILKMLTIMER